MRFYQVDIFSPTINAGKPSLCSVSSPVASVSVVECESLIIMKIRHYKAISRAGFPRKRAARDVINIIVITGSDDTDI